MSMLAERVDVVIGVDTHADTHTAAICDARGGVIHKLTVQTTEAGYGDLLQAAVAHAGGPRVVWAVEGTGSYGAALTRTLRELGQEVIEVRGAKRPRGQGKNDGNDAAAIARAALAQTRPAQPRKGRVRQTLRLRTVARDIDVAHRTRLTNQFCAMLLTAPEPIRARLRGLSTRQALAAARHMRVTASTGTGEDVHALIQVLRQTAAKIKALDTAIAQADAELDRLTTTHAPDLRAQFGVGPVTAAKILIAYSHPGRFHSEAAFAALAGVSPLEASSGKTRRHRLNRTGDRQLNAALHTIIRTRRQHKHPETIAYVERRSAQNKTSRDINRCLKRALARRLYRLLETMPAMP